MNSSERVLAALQMKKPDRVPVIEFIVDRKVARKIYPDFIDIQDFMDQVGYDAVCCKPVFSKIKENDDGTYVDEWGVTYKADDLEEIAHPLRGPIETFNDAVAYSPPDPDAPHRLGNLADVVSRYKGKRAILIHHRVSFMHSAYLMGMDNLLAAFLLEPKLAELVMDKMLETNMRIIRNAIRAGFRWLESGMSLEDQAKAFQQAGGKIGVYDYFEYPLDWSMGLNVDLPTYTKASRVYELARLIRHYRDIGFTTYDAEGSCTWGPSGLGYWVYARTSWNPDLDARKLTSDFYQNAFGAAARPVSCIYERWAAGEKYDAARLHRMYADLAQAYRLNKDSAVRARLDQLAVYFHFLMLGMEFDALGKQKDSNDKLIAVGQELAIYTRRISETGLTQFYAMLYQPYWTEWRFKPLYSIPNFEAEKAIEKWREERTDLPTSDEVADTFRKDLARVEELRRLPESGAKAYDLKSGEVE